ncbi:pectinacetylesterase family protein (macronuclear) [Tetrahymena thermophila SB210]|uniref:Pectinacetylesterase family protein n=1 Tax=Tetrahymena thermophila (strain SB210) TaxID=312017 RepID=I7ML33_TETTS|nr:pectinacetylesterase family protein [Tetrahymena thermophila SB210]EAS01086.2 pectinacetylesterase family protein [Tetrahymena thermophila SB210]|eukprot:XP_001021331.2 pectinacetylesterase family protein [Tetrahymena thermophila SB210]
MRIIKTIFLIIAILYCVCCQNNNLYFLSPNTRARCIDGTQPGFYFNKGYGDGADKFFIFLDGGGRCEHYTLEGVLEACYQRASTILGSSNQWPLSFIFGQYFFYPSQNSVMYNWNQVFVRYCDGHLYQGSSEPINYKNMTMYFRGYDNMVELFNSLSDNFGLKQSSTVVLSGGSAGGVATLYWTKYLRNFLNPKIKVLAAPDSSFYPDINPMASLQAQVWDLITNNRRFLIQPSGCPYINDDANAYKCGYLQYITDLIPVPTFIIQSIYDEYTLRNKLNVNCITPTHGLQNCTSDEIARGVALQNETLKQLNIIKANKPDWGFWVISCILHCFFPNMASYSTGQYAVPQLSGNTVSKSLSTFIQVHTSNSTVDITQIPKLFDNVTYPNNVPCNGLY